MATTGTYTYNPTASTIITEVLRYLGVLEEGGSASPTQITDSLPAFEMYIKGLGKYGLNLWAIETQSITLVDSTCSYVPDTKLLKITDMVYRDAGGSDTIMIPLTRDEYWNLNDKDQESQPTQFYYDTQEEQLSSTIYLWPCPNDVSAGNGETIEVVGQILFEDVGDGTNELDVPQEWIETIKYGLATRLAPMYGYPVQERNLLSKEYQQMLNDSLDFDTEQESIYLRPDYSRQIAP